MVRALDAETGSICFLLEAHALEGVSEAPSCSALHS